MQFTEYKNSYLKLNALKKLPGYLIVVEVLICFTWSITIAGIKCEIVCVVFLDVKKVGEAKGLKIPVNVDIV